MNVININFTVIFFSAFFFIFKVFSSSNQKVIKIIMDLYLVNVQSVMVYL